MEINNKHYMLMCIIVVLMTGLGYVGGLISHNVMVYKEAQSDCYEWIQTECPCLFPTHEVPLNITIGGQNVLEQENITGE